MLSNNILLFSVLFSLVLFSFGCEDEDGGGNACSSDFDQAAMLADYADDLIIPAVNNLNERALELNLASTDFLNATNQDNLERLRNEIRLGYLLYVAQEMLEVGPATDIGLRDKLNSFPADGEKIEEKIGPGGNATEEAFANGFPALEYLFFSDRTDEELLALFDADNGSPEARAFLGTTSENIVNAISEVYTAWAGDYRATWVSNTGTAAGTSVSQLINALNEHWERTKRDRLGIPAGVVTLGITNPETVEGRFLGNSLDLLTQSVTKNRLMFRTGLDAYLNAVNAQKDGQALTDLIEAQYAAGLEAIALIDGPLAEAVDQDSDDVTEAYAALVRNIVLLKTDMPSTLCVAITYVDNPSDSD